MSGRTPPRYIIDPRALRAGPVAPRVTPAFPNIRPPRAPSRSPILPPPPVGRVPVNPVDPLTGQPYPGLPYEPPNLRPGEGDEYRGDPLHLTATSVLQSGAANGVNTEALKNPTGGPMEILEVKFSLRVPILSLVGCIQIDGGSVGVKFDLGNDKITNGYIPVWLFGREDNLGAEQLDGEDFVYAEYRWKLSHPLYVPNGAVLTPMFQHFGLVKQTVTARISYGARTLPRGASRPKTIKAPYVAAWASKAFSTFGAADTDQSRETDLVNASGRALTLHRFVGRINGYGLGASSIVFVSDTEPSNQRSQGATGVGSVSMRSRLLTMTMVDKNEQFMVRDSTLFGSVFPLVTRSWEIGPGVVVPKDWFSIVYLSKAAPVVVPAGAFFAQAHISMVGTQEVPL